MTRERHAYWSAYIADLQGRMLLADWEVILDRKPPDNSDWAAGVVITHGRHLARISLYEDFDSCTRTEQRHDIVHELLHMHLWSLRSHLKQQFGGLEGWVIIRDAHVSHEEFAVDQLARIIAPRMPLPPKVKP